MNDVRYGQSTKRREDGCSPAAGNMQTMSATPVHCAPSSYGLRTCVVRSIDIWVALAHPGVIAVLTGADMASEGFNDCPAPFTMPQGDGTFAVETSRPLLVRERVRFVGEPVAMVLAESEVAAQVGCGARGIAPCDARDVFVTSELGLDADGRFTALGVRYDINVGAYGSARSTTPINNFGGIADVYTTPLIAGVAVGIFTHAQATAAYLSRRGPAGRTTPMPSSASSTSRRRRWASTRPSCDGATSSRRRRCRTGRRSSSPTTVETSSATWTRRSSWRGTPAFPSGARGRGSEGGCAASESPCRSRRGDTDLLEDGRGNGGSSALIIGGTAITSGVDDLIDKATKIASSQLEVSTADLQLSDGEFRVVGTDLKISLAESRA